MGVLVYAVMKPGPAKELAIPVSEFVNRVQEGQVKDATVAGNDVRGTLANGSTFHTQIPTNFPEIYKLLSDKNVRWESKDSSAGGWLSIVLNASLPILLLVGFWIFMARQMQSGGNKAL